MPSGSSKFDVLVVGGGPAGIAAAITAAKQGVKVGLVDDNATPGGQIWRGAAEKKDVPESSGWFDDLRRSPVVLIPQARVFHQPRPGWVIAETPDGSVDLQYEKLILATGARERFLPFSGWTLPNVMGAGGLQALVKSGLPIVGKRVVVAGTGPLLLAVAAYLRKQRAEIPIVAEQASRKSLVLFAAALLRHSGKLAQAWQLNTQIRGARFTPNSWPTEAHGTSKLESVTLSVNGKTETIACEYLACGFHLVPNIELASLLGCELRQGYVRVNEFQETSIASIFCAGEPTGIGGLELSLIEGQIAGLAASGNLKDARHLFLRRKKLQSFLGIMERAFCLRPELRQLAEAETIVCRCEDVCVRQLRQHTSWRAAKLHTRCGMGPCQGRICGPATEFIFNWRPESVRPPVFPVLVEALASSQGAATS